MPPIAWRYINDWQCIACGICCKEYDVALRFNEWLNIVRVYGIEATVPGLNKVYLKRRSDGSCIFLRRMGYGQEKQAVFPFNGRKFYVYVDPACIGIKWGNPSQRLIEKVIPEFIRIASGQPQPQQYSTANLNKLYMQIAKPGMYVI